MEVDIARLVEKSGRGLFTPTSPAAV